MLDATAPEITAHQKKDQLLADVRALFRAQKEALALIEAGIEVGFLLEYRGSNVTGDEVYGACDALSKVSIYDLENQIEQTFAGAF